VGGRIRTCCNHADHLVARSVKRIVVGQIAGPNDLDARVGQTALGELFGKNAGLRAGEINEGRIRIDVAYPLQKWGKIRLASGMRIASMICPPAWMKRVLKAVSASTPAPVSATGISVAVKSLSG
jgi:hypothetical protein